MNLLLIRHSLAVDPGAFAGSDFKRPLTPRGRQQFESMAQWLVARGFAPEQIFCSPLLRAMETADILRQAAGLTEEQSTTMDFLNPRLNITEMVANIRRSVAETIACVGHEPDMSSTASQLVGGGIFGFSPATITCIEFRGRVDISAGRLKWMLSPQLFPA